MSETKMAHTKTLLLAVAALVIALDEPPAEETSMEDAVADEAAAEGASEDSDEA